MVSQIFSTLGDIISAFATMLVSLFGDVVKIFYDATANDNAGELTIVGILSLVALGTGLVIWAFQYIKRLITSASTRSR